MERLPLLLLPCDMASSRLSTTSFFCWSYLGSTKMCLGWCLSLSNFSSRFCFLSSSISAFLPIQSLNLLTIQMHGWITIITSRHCRWIQIKAKITHLDLDHSRLKKKNSRHCATLRMNRYFWCVRWRWGACDNDSKVTDIQCSILKASLFYLKYGLLKKLAD